MVLAVTLGALLVVGVAALGLRAATVQDRAEEAIEQQQLARRTGPLAMPPVPAPAAASPGCAAVLEALPERLTISGDPVGRREIADPAPPATVAWGDRDHDPVTLRCGIEAPAELNPSSPLREISGVRWLPISEAGSTSWFAVDGPVRVALTLPGDSGTGPLQEISEALRPTHGS
ncbi:DUF3515 family protein [Allosaccharopolyspora coralli]|uniref:DUF3515 family protein n=1 Tax=Allosaccharopolyspora coralli TaxID=2665642 RepID=A0A5Q3QDB9_9PSEU|nr:DUF3515 family protein [Allosaccharopolyspora coralli]